MAAWVLALQQAVGTQPLLVRRHRRQLHALQVIRAVAPAVTQDQITAVTADVANFLGEREWEKRLVAWCLRGVPAPCPCSLARETNALPTVQLLQLLHSPSASEVASVAVLTIERN